MINLLFDVFFSISNNNIVNEEYILGETVTDDYCINIIILLLLLYKISTAK